MQCIGCLAARMLMQVAKSELAFCSHARRLTKPGFAEVFGLNGEHRERLGGTAADFATRSTARRARTIMARRWPRVRRPRRRWEAMASCWVASQAVMAVSGTWMVMRALRGERRGPVRRSSAGHLECRWPAVRWPGAISCSAGTSAAERPNAQAQRSRSRQPEGRLAASPSSPLIGRSSRGWSVRGRGTALISAWV